MPNLLGGTTAEVNDGNALTLAILGGQWNEVLDQEGPRTVESRWGIEPVFLGEFHEIGSLQVDPVRFGRRV